MDIRSVLSRQLISARLLSVLSTGVILSACQPTTEHQPNLTFTAPEKILQVRAVDQSQLRPVVRLSDGRTIQMRSNGDNSWSGTIIVQPNNSYFVSVEWIETLPEGDLVLAQWAEDVPVDNDGYELVLSNDRYNFSLDFDGDQVTNLDERIADTNPFVPNDQASESNSADNNNSANGNNNTDNTDNGTDSDSSTDNTDSSDNQSSDNSDDDNSTDANVNPSLTHTKASVLVPRITPNQAPFIDGLGVNLNGQDQLIGEWKDAVQVDDAGDGLWIDNLMLDNDADAADGAQLRRWAAMHDGDNLYILVLSDDVGQRHADSTKSWQDDSLELFIDGDNSKVSDWTSGEDFHMVIPLLKSNSTQANNEINGFYTPEPGSVEAAATVEFSTGPGVGPDGIRISRWEQDVYEISVPLSSVGIVLGLPFGFEVQLNDDDNGDDRDSKWGWFHPSLNSNFATDQTYRNPSVMGVLVLEE